MFVRDFVHVERPLDEVRARLVSEPAVRLRPLARRAYDESEVLRGLLAGTGHALPPGSSEVELAVGPVRLRDDALVLPMLWGPGTDHPLLPPIEADLEVAPVGSEWTQLTLVGNYTRRPSGALRRRDDLLLHRVLEASVRSFLVAVARWLEEEA
ncbi:MAG: hypothetical protein M5U14_21385 [Acidimicrobiia bacterium]|nr:hypothetical protein [Acidimicrobiia bacterium]